MVEEEKQRLTQLIQTLCKDNADTCIKELGLPYIKTILESNPYFLFEQGYSEFKDIDAFANINSFDRRKTEIRSCLMNVLQKNEEKGHTYIKDTALNYWVKNILNAGKHKITYDIYPFLNYYNQTFYYNKEKGIVSFNKTYRNECIIKKFVSEYHSKRAKFHLVNIPSDIDNEKLDILRDIDNHRLSIITGGPGTGKTTWLKSFLNSLPEDTIVSVTATTGKASRRTAEVLQDIAAGNYNISISTLHKFLGYGHKLSRAEILNIKSTDILIIDEASMLDDDLTALLFDTINNTDMTVIFVGDVNQLPSVGSGNILNDLQLLGVYTYHLTKNFRSNNFTIRYNSDEILAGKDDLVYDNTFELKPLEEVYLERDRIILTPYINDSIEYSATKINEFYRSDKYHDDRPFHTGDEIIFLHTDYGEGYMNGDTGVITNIDANYYYILLDNIAKTVKVYDKEEIMLSHAITIHKSQGSEFKEVAICIPEFNEEFTTVNLLYTAITRAKEKVVIYSTPEVLKQCISNKNKPRQTMLSLSVA